MSVMAPMAPMAESFMIASASAPRTPGAEAVGEVGQPVEVQPAGDQGHGRERQRGCHQVRRVVEQDAYPDLHAGGR